MTPDVSVIIPARSEEPYLEEAIASVLSQGPMVKQVLVCCGAHGGQGPHRVQDRGGAVAVVRAGDGSVSENLNAGLARADGTWLAFLDADDVWPAQRLARGLAAFARLPDLDLCFGRQVAMTADGRLGVRAVDARVRGTALMRRATAARIGPFPARPAETIAWLMRADELGLRSVVLPDVLLHRRAHDGNLTRQSQTRIRAEYLTLARESMRRQKRGQR